jgi:hypothetical protein
VTGDRPTSRWTPFAGDALLFVALLAAGLLRYADALRRPLLADDVAVARAIELVQAGRSPYEHARYLYPPPLAEWGARAAARFGLHPTLVALRVAVIAGAALLALLTARLVLRSRLAVAAAAFAILLLAPWVTSGIELGNPSPLVAGMLTASLLLLPERRATSGAILGVSLAVKPLAAGGLFVLARSPRARWAALVAVAVAAVTVLLTPAHLGDMLHQDQSLDATAGGNVSIHRVIALLLGVAPAPVVSLAVVGGFVAWAARVDDERALGWIAATASVFALPRVWLHTLSALVPVIAVALSRAPVRAVPGESRDARGRRLLRVAGILLATVGLLVADGFAFVPFAPRPVQALLAAVPFACACALLRVAVAPQR